MNIVRVKPLEAWKSAVGLCLICGTPLGLTPSHKSNKEEGLDHNYDVDDSVLSLSRTNKERGDIITTSDEGGEEINDDAWRRGGDSLEENFIRVSMFKFNLLGKMDACHIIDQYTFLKPKESNTFKKALLENKAVIEAMGGNLSEDAFKDGAFEKAADYCQRVAAKRVVPGCAACNAAMNRSNTHADIVYRCFEPTAKLNIPELEDSTTKTNRVVSRGIVVKKLIQQVALYFTPIKKQVKENDDQVMIHWENKEESEIMPQAAVWRCIANLCMWGKSGGTVRFGLIAVFYGAVYIFERLKMGDLMVFTDWHVHVFRNFYMENYLPATWFGMTQQEASVRFDATRKEGLKWCNIVTTQYLDTACEAIDTFFRSKVSLPKITHFKDILLMHVFDERTLFIFLCKKCGAKGGVQALMRFYLYNFENPRSVLLLARAHAFMQDIRKPITRELLHQLKTNSLEKEGDGKKNGNHSVLMFAIPEKKESLEPHEMEEEIVTEYRSYT